MSDTFLTESQEARSRVSAVKGSIFAGRRGRRIQESLLAYIFLLPAFFIVFLFGLFPLAFSAFESSLRGLNNILGRQDGLGNYVRAIDNLTYILGFWLAIILVYAAVRSILSIRETAGKYEDRPLLMAFPGFIFALGFALTARFVFIFLPELLGIPEKMRGQEVTRQLFLQFFGEAWRVEAVQAAFRTSLTVFLLGLLVTFLVFRFTSRSRHSGGYLAGFIQAGVMLLGAAALAWITWSEIQRAYAEVEAGETLEIWPQVIMISAGFILLFLSWLLWRSASNKDSNLSTAFRLGAAAALMVGAWVLIGELPRVIAAGDEDWWIGLQATVYYSVGTIPFQLLISLLLATLLFQNLRGKTFFRVIFFLPYIAPFVGTAAAFRILFSGRANAPVNSLLGALGFGSLQWLNEPTGIFQMILGSNATLPDWAVGPSLALIVIMIFGTWTFFGFNTVVFLAGLGSIPSELYEAAAIDGAGRWSQFRHVTLPLLSPTIYFLTLWATIGTFKAFNHIYVLRNAAALGTTDTASVVIFQQFKRDTRFGYASALAILLLLIILIMTFVNNRIASRRVFYG